MTLSERLTENVRACFSSIWIESCEHEDAILEIGPLCHRENWQLATWSINQRNETSGADPLAAVRSLDSMATDDDTPALLVLTNFHRFLGSAEIVQAVADQIQRGKNRRTFLVILAPVVQIPTELEKLFCLHRA